MVSFDYKYLPISDLRVELTEDQKTGKQRVKSVLVHDEPLEPTERFWTSLFARYGFNKAFFKYFDHAEVFERISNKENKDRMRVCIERNEDNGHNRLLAATNPTRPVVVHDELINLLERYDGEGISYANGIVESTHRPRVGNNFDVAGDVFSNRFVMSTPVDGYGQPNIYLSLLRQICSNGMIGYARAFRSDLSLGKGNEDTSPVIVRALEGFNSGDGYAVLRQRLEAATKSWASVYEVTSLQLLLTKLHHGQLLNVDDPTLQKGTSLHGYLQGESDLVSPLVTAFHSMTGDTTKLYGLANLDSLSVKRQRTLPVRCKVYDAINFATEVATHYAKPTGARQINAWVGELIANEYDMDSTCSEGGMVEFQDFFMERRLAVPELTGV